MMPQQALFMSWTRLDQKAKGTAQGARAGVSVSPREEG